MLYQLQYTLISTQPIFVEFAILISSIGVFTLLFEFPALMHILAVAQQFLAVNLIQCKIHSKNVNRSVAQLLSKDRSDSNSCILRLVVSQSFASGFKIFWHC
ncbi:Hypothetical_protein [Hexamita inflata]|uniref:Hypothetical_protein n=1 Tax=Hexamita inflata TaxID=28002 RepID=A0AA86Q8K8_9EUKA|nr:Hypothetical protein HINF_LOCUS35724 [Hexamita inflata]CAI9948082.1 Hypothetical protein HINF_LOCUS35727 [Hexamita inflata]